MAAADVARLRSGSAALEAARARREGGALQDALPEQDDEVLPMMTRAFF